MTRAVGFAIFLILSIYGQCQVTFYGKPESIKSLNTSSAEDYLFVDYKTGKVFFTRSKFRQNPGGSKDAGDIWTGNINQPDTEAKHWPLNDAAFASPIGSGLDGSFWMFNKVIYRQGVHIGGVYAINMDGSGYRPLEIPFFRNKSPLQTGSLSVDKRYLLLSMESNNTYGVDDLYVCILQGDGSWGAPINLGYSVNSKLQELTPFLAADNKTLFFASNGHGGEGSFDIFKSERLDDSWRNWSKPENLGPMINTSGSETSFSIGDGDYAYFVSTQNSDGYGDIKRIKVKADIEEVEITQVVTLKVYEPEKTTWKFVIGDKKTGRPIEGTAIAMTAEDTTYNRGARTGEVSVHSEGIAAFMEFKADGYLSATRQLPPGYKTPIADTIWLESLETGNVITLQNVLFYQSTANFVEGSEAELDLVSEMMNENPDVKILLKGHTDNVGNATLNLHLSKERVMAVKDYLISSGIDPSRIEGEGFGGFNPIASNDTEETRKLNRRVEFEVIRD